MPLPFSVATGYYRLFAPVAPHRSHTLTFEAYLPLIYGAQEDTNLSVCNCPMGSRRGARWSGRCIVPWSVAEGHDLFACAWQRRRATVAPESNDFSAADHDSRPPPARTRKGRVVRNAETRTRTGPAGVEFVSINRAGQQTDARPSPSMARHFFSRTAGWQRSKSHVMRW